MLIVRWNFCNWMWAARKQRLRHSPEHEQKRKWNARVVQNVRKMSHSDPQVHIVIAAAHCGHLDDFTKCKSVTDKQSWVADNGHHLRCSWHHVPNVRREFIFGVRSRSLIEQLALNDINIFFSSRFISDLCTIWRQIAAIEVAFLSSRR